MIAIIIGVIILVLLGLNSLMAGIISTKQSNVNNRNALAVSAIFAAVAFLGVIILMVMAHKKAGLNVGGLAELAAL